MALVTTPVPFGPLPTLCVQQQLGWNCTPPECAVPSLGQHPEDFETICCDGMIIDITQKLYGSANSSRFDLRNLVCCGVHGAQQGGIGPINTVQTLCTEGSPTPLASLAATNTNNAALYRVTYTSASYGTGTDGVGDFIPTSTPYCLWAYTKSGVHLVNVTVPAADITTPSASALCQDAFGGTVIPYSTSSSHSTSSTLWTQSVTTASATSSNAAFTPTSSQTPLRLLVLGGVMCGVRLFSG